jgi:flagellar hook-associated protein 2
MGTISSALASSNSSTGSGIDVQGTVNQILAADRAPEQLWQTQVGTFNAKSSALQGINSDLQDLQTKVNALNDVGGAFGAKSVSVSNPNIIAATAEAAATTGTHTVIVGTLATTSSYYSGYPPTGSSALSTGTTPLATGTSFSLAVGSNTAVSIPIDATHKTNTLNGLAAYINNLGMGVTASVVTDAGGVRLALTSNASGAPGDLTVSSDTTGLGFTKAVTGVDASLTVDGVPVNSASNTVNVIPGVTLNLLSTSASQVTITVQPDTTQATQAINSFVSSYNKIIGDINGQFNYNSQTKTAGILSGDSTLQLLQQQLLSAVSSVGSEANPIQSLASLGITLNNDGTLTVNGSQLQNALSTNYQNVQSFFQAAATGFATQLSSELDNLTNPTSGAITIEINGLTQSASDLTNQINDFEARLMITQQQLINQYSQINATLEQLPILLSQINSQIASLPSKG